ncbi:MAG: lmo0937 family membrane protein [Xanthomonadales bacterium]|nr:lmo0937 family membrane protein [Xanthomonadales bacterium]
MLENIAYVLLLLWAIGLMTSYTMGGLIHVLLVIALVLVILRLVQGRRVI